MDKTGVAISQVTSPKIKTKGFFKYKESYILLAPFFVIFFTFTVLPVIISMGLSLTSYDMLEAPRWVAWDNFVNLIINDDVFLIAIKNTFIFAVITGPVSYILCLLFAWFIHELRPKIRAFMVVMFYAPSISGQLYFIWQIMFDGDSYGYINSFLLKYGFILEPVQWLKNPSYIMPIIIIVQLWLSLGTSFLAFIAGLSGIDRNLYEAAAIDGIKNRWQELWYVTLPAMRPLLVFGAVMQITASFSVSAVPIALAGFPSPDYAAHTIMTHLLDYGGIRFEMGYASAIATILFTLMVCTNKIVRRILGRVGE